MIQAILNVTISYKPPADGGSKETGKIVTVGEDEEDEGIVPSLFLSFRIPEKNPSFRNPRNDQKT